MRERPIYLGPLCWIIVFSCAWKLVKGFTYLDSPGVRAQMATIHLPIPVQIAQYWIALIVPLACGILMSDGKNWARVAFITWGIANFLLDALTHPDKSDFTLNASLFSGAAILLLIPRTRGWFLLPQHHS